LRLYCVNDEFLCTLKEEEEREYLAARQHLLNQTAADEQIAKELQEQSLQVCSKVTINLFLLGNFSLLKAEQNFLSPMLFLNLNCRDLILLMQWQF
jgi:hypothetical protein